MKKMRKSAQKLKESAKRWIKAPKSCEKSSKN